MNDVRPLIRPSVALVTVSYNTRDWLARCLASIGLAVGDHDYEVIVVDNASSDGSADFVEATFPKATLVRSDENLGFARGVNLGVSHATADYVLLVNPDGELEPGAVERLLAFAEAHPDYVVCGGRTVSPAGDLDPRSCWAAPTVWSLLCGALMLSTAFPRSPFDPEAMGSFGRDRVQVVDIVTGCLLLMRLTDWQALGGFDEQFFMYGEDADLCLRASASGRHCAITPEATMIHAVGASSAQRPDKLVLVMKGRITLVRKHWPVSRRRLGIALMVFGVWVRAMVEGLMRNRAQTWTTVWARRADWRRGYEPGVADAAPWETGTGRSSMRTGPARVLRFVRSVLDPRGLVHLIRLLHYFNYTHVAERGKLSAGPDVRLAPNVSLANAQRISLGARTRVGARTSLWAGDHSGRITIGSDCNFGPLCFVTASNYGIEPDQLILDQPKVEADVTIGDDVWFGTGVVVVAGVTIGSGAVIAAGSVVTADVPPNSVAGGVPARVIRSRSVG